MAKFSQAFLRSMTEPSYQEGLFTAAQQLGGLYQERQKMQQRADIQNTARTLVEQGAASAEQGDAVALNKRSQDLSELLSTTVDPTLRDNLTTQLSALNALKPTARDNALTKNAMAVINGKKGITELDEQIESLNQEALQLDPMSQEAIAIVQRKRAIEKTRNAIQGRINELEQDPKINLEIKEIEYKTDLASLTREEELQTKGNAVYLSRLTGLDPKSEEWQAIAKEAENRGFTQAIEESKLNFYALETARLEAEDLRNSVGPLTKAELQDAIQLTGMDEKTIKALNPVTVRSALSANLLKKAEAKTVTDINRNLQPSIIQAKAIARTALNEIRKTGDFEGIPIPLGIFRDISDKISNLEEEDIQPLMDRLDGKMSLADIVNETKEWLRETFPTQMKEYDEMTGLRRQNQIDIEAVFQALRSDPLNKDFTDDQLKAFATEEVGLR